MKKVVLYILIFVPSFLYAQEKMKMDLKECINLAMENNPGVQQFILQAKAGKVVLNQSKANLLPSLNMNYNTGVNQGRSIDPFTNSYINQQYSFASPSIGSSVTLFNGFALFNNIRKNLYSYEADKMQLQQARDELTLNVLYAYLQVLTNKEQLTLAATQKEATQKQVDRLAVLNEEGAVAPGEYYDLKGIFAGDELAIINARNTLENSKLFLLRLMNSPYNENMDIQPIDTDLLITEYSITSVEVYQSALKHLALVKVADLRRKSADMDVKLSRSEFYPSLFLNAGLNSNYSGAAPVKYKTQIDNNRNSTVYAGLNIPIFNSFRTRNAVLLAKLDRKTADIVARQARIGLRQITDEAFFNLQFSREKYLISIRQLADFNESFKRAEARFTLGAGTVVDYIVSRNNYDKANINLVNAKYDLLFRMKILDYYQGKLNP